MEPMNCMMAQILVGQMVLRTVLAPAGCCFPFSEQRFTLYQCVKTQLFIFPKHGKPGLWTYIRFRRIVRRDPEIRFEQMHCAFDRHAEQFRGQVDHIAVCVAGEAVEMIGIKLHAGVMVIVERTD